MDTFSPDENGNVTIFDDLPAYQSTPKTSRKRPKTIAAKFVCNVCQREYIKEFYYKKHLASHNQSQQVRQHNDTQAVDESTDGNLSMNDLSLSLLYSGPKNAEKTFKVPAAPPLKKRKGLGNRKKSSLVCTYCLKQYVCTKSFQSHVRMHIMQDACKRFPDTKKILENIKDISTIALTAVSNAVACGSEGKKFKEFVGHVVGSEHFLDFSKSVGEELLLCVVDKKVLLPSALMNSLYEKEEEIISDNDMCNHFMEILSVSEFEPDTQSQFFLEFILNFTIEIFRFISKTYSDQSRPKEMEVTELDLEERQVVFYIGGSIMRGYLKMGRRYRKNVKWQEIVFVLKTKVLCDKPEGDIEAQWTAEQDRGGLHYIQTPVQFFFKRVVLVVYSCEKHDGSICFEEVLTKVSNSDIPVDWDNIIADSLSEGVSVNLMNDIITCFSRTCGRGIAKRRLNFVRKKPVISMATRVSVARRKKK